MYDFDETLYITEQLGNEHIFISGFVPREQKAAIGDRVILINLAVSVAGINDIVLLLRYEILHVGKGESVSGNKFPAEMLPPPATPSDLATPSDFATSIIPCNAYIITHTIENVEPEDAGQYSVVIYYVVNGIERTLHVGPISLDVDEAMIEPLSSFNPRWPLAAHFRTITSLYVRRDGSRHGRMTGWWNDHFGGFQWTDDPNRIMDIDTRQGYNVYAVESGVVAYSGTMSSFGGNVIIIRHHNGERSFYALYQGSQRRVNVGEPVHRGSVIGITGSSHIHFELTNHNLRNLWTITRPGWNWERTCGGNIDDIPSPRATVQSATSDTNNRTVTVTWTAVNNPTDFEVILHRYPWDGSPQSRPHTARVSASTRSYTFTNVAPGYYNASVISNPGRTNWTDSNWVSVGIGAPATIWSTFANPDNRTVEISWTSVNNPTGYTLILERYPWDGSPQSRPHQITLPAGTRSHIFTNVAPGYYNAFIYTLGPGGVPSNRVSVGMPMPQVATVQSASSTPATSTLNGTVTINWTSVNNPTGYTLILERYPWDGSPQSRPHQITLPAGTRSHMFINVTPGYYNAFIYTDPGNRASNRVSVSVDMATAPAAITDLKATPGNGRVTLNWTAPNNGGYAITQYEFRQRIGTGTWGSWTSTGSTATSHVVTGLINGTTHQFQVRAVNAAGNAPVSNIVSATPATIHVGYFIIHPVGQIIRLGQTVVFTVEFTDSLEHTIRWQVSTDDGENWANLYGATGLTLTIPNVPFAMNGNKYRVRAESSEGVVYSDYATLAVIPDTTLIVATVTSATRDRMNVQLSLDNNPGFAAMAMRLSFADELTLIGYELGRPGLTDEQLEDLEYGFTAPTLGGGDSFMGWAGRNTDLDLSGVLLTLTFAVDATNERVGDFLPIEVVFENNVPSPEYPTNAEDERLYIGIVNGGVNVVVRFVLGDANRNGNVTSADATVLARHLADHGVRINLRAMDLNDDEYVDGADLVFLVRWLMGRGPAPPGWVAIGN